MTNTVVIVPCYNESRRMQTALFSAFLQQHRDISLLLVNDGSTDRTQQVLKILADRHPDQVHVLELVKNGGKAEAVRRGWLHATQQHPEYVAYWDADLAAPLAAIPRFRDVLQRRSELQVVIGSRVALLGRRIDRRWYRHLMGRGFATCASWVLGLAVYDTQCGAKMFRVSPKTSVAFEQPFQSRWIFDVEILARLVRGPCQSDQSSDIDWIYELPLDEWRDVDGSKLRPRDFVKAVVELIAILQRYRLGSRVGHQESTPSTVPTQPMPGFATRQSVSNRAVAAGERSRAA